MSRQFVRMPRTGSSFEAPHTCSATVWQWLAASPNNEQGQPLAVELKRKAYGHSQFSKCSCYTHWLTKHACTNIRTREGQYYICQLPSFACPFDLHFCLLVPYVLINLTSFSCPKLSSCSDCGKLNTTNSAS